MRICHISYSDGPFGAGRSAYQLHHQLCRHGIDSIFFTKKKTSSDKTVISFNQSNSIVANIRRNYYIKKYNNEIISNDFESNKKKFEIMSFHHHVLDTRDVLRQIPKADIYCLHWVARFFDVRIIQRLSGIAPVIWRLCDMNPLTGGCHYSNGCIRFCSQCGACPALGSNNEFDISRISWKYIAAALQEIIPNRFLWLAQSQWVADLVRNHPVASLFPVHLVRNGVDINIFFPRDKAIVRKSLGLPINSFIILFINDSSGKTARKGSHFLEGIARKLKGIDNLHFICMGSESIPNIPKKFPITNFGRQYYSLWVSLIMNSADILIFPSMEDNCPNVVLESMASGTVVVGWDILGVKELIQDEITGLIATNFNLDDFVTKIKFLYDNCEARQRIAHDAWEYIKVYRNRNVQVDEFLGLVKKIL
ncbi:glycosyltransferase [Desulfonatronum thiodismutans]|uniref:glycosyltransferase n=1 Tax=Desulfonatronum thiodismutans TaxID=159290 RepID=UPI000A04B32F|nr:glycosyltransferase [Desulfonatronum thiodismutans]